ncbi:MAG TPA: ABC transporter permease [bacterium]|nr:ABC transporter permease [bacterium]
MRGLPPAPRASSSPLAALGGSVLHGLAQTGSASLMLASAFRWILRGHLELSQSIVQIGRIGAGSVGLIFVTGLFSGMVLALQSSRQLIEFGAEAFIGGLVGLSLAREAGPVFTAIVVAGRAGAGMAAEIGTMNVTEQVDALRVLATDPVRYLVVPRLIAAAFALPVLTIFANLIGGIGGYAVATATAGINSDQYVAAVQRFVLPYDLLAGLIKTVFFGLIIAAVGCFRGLHASGGADGVGRATTGAVVAAIAWILVVNYFLDLILFT